MNYRPRFFEVILIEFVFALACHAGVTREHATPDAVGLSNDLVAIQFGRHSGELVSLKNLVSSDEYLKGQADGGNPFRVYADATQTPKVLTVAIPYPIQPVEDAMGGTLIDPKNCKLVDSSFLRQEHGGVLRLVSRSDAPKLIFELQITLPDDEIAAEMILKIQNEGSKEHSVMAAAPYLTGLSLGPKRETNLGVRLVGYGQSRAPAWENQGDVYGRLWNGQWNAVYEPSLNEGLGLIVKDPDLRNKVMRRFPPAGMSVFYCDNTPLAPGQTIDYPPAQILVHKGNWKTVARRYGQWMRRAFAIRQPPDWLNDVDMQMGGAWFPSAPDVARAKDPPDIGCDNRPAPPGVLTSFAQLPRMFYYPCDMRSSSQYWQSVVTTGRYHAYHHTDGIYDIRTDLGGVPAYRDGIARVRKLGRYYGLYVGVKTIRKDSPLLKNSNPQDWILMDTPDRRVPENEDSFYVCAGDPKWQDHLAQTCKRLVRDLGVNFIRLDEFAGTFDPCHNPVHHHKTPYGSMQWSLELLRKVRAAVDDIDPNVSLFSEGPSDVTAQYLDGSLNGWSTGPDIAPCQLAVPSLRGMGYSSGQIECAINGFIPGHLYACNRGGWANGYHEKLWGAGIEPMPEGYPQKKPNELWPGTKLRWHELGHTFIDAARFGDPTDDLPTAQGVDPKQWAAQLWRSPKYWLLVCGDVAARRPAQPVRMKLPELPEDVRYAFEFDAATLKMRDAQLSREPDGVFVTVTSGFSAVLLPRPECPPVVLLDDPPPLVRDGAFDLKLSALAPWRKETGATQVTARVSGFDMEPVTVSLPGSIHVSAPANAEPGYCCLRLTGNCLSIKRWFMYDPAALVDQLQPEIVYGAY